MSSNEKGLAGATGALCELVVEAKSTDVVLLIARTNETDGGKCRTECSHRIASVCAG